MIKALVITIAAVALTGCGMVEKTTAELRGYSKICVDGVTYLQFSSGATVQVDLQGNPVACNK
jgi:uncharacterized protein YceK